MSKGPCYAMGFLVLCLGIVDWNGFLVGVGLGSIALTLEHKS